MSLKFTPRFEIHKIESLSTVDNFRNRDNQVIREALERHWKYTGIDID